jgi:hypothetical protein
LTKNYSFKGYILLKKNEKIKDSWVQSVTMIVENTESKWSKSKVCNVEGHKSENLKGIAILSASVRQTISLFYRSDRSEVGILIMKLILISLR